MTIKEIKRQHILSELRLKEEKKAVEVFEEMFSEV